MGFDNRGVERGGCLVLGCSCGDFVALPSRYICGSCRHPPAKHVSETQPVPPPYPPPAAQDWRSRGYSTGDMSHHSHSHPRASVHQTHLIRTSTICQQCRKPCAVLVSGLRCERCTRLCKREGCSSPRYYDLELGEFEYCSPQCRNKDCLPLYDSELKYSLGQSKERHMVDDPLESSSSSTLRRSSSQSSIILCRPACPHIPRRHTDN